MAYSKCDDWDNAQEIVEDGGQTYIETTQSLDWASGAGRMNLDRAFDVQVNGQRDVEGLSIGEIGEVEVKGWDYGIAHIGTNNDYGIRVEYDGNTFDNLEEQVWGTEGYEQDYAVSWFGTAIPEPAMAGIYIFFVFAVVSLRRLLSRFKTDGET